MKLLYACVLYELLKIACVNTASELQQVAVGLTGGPLIYLFLLRLYWATFIAIVTIMGGLGSCRMSFSQQGIVMFGDFKDFSREPELVCNLIFSSKIEFLPWRRQ